jgi:hypothetical protein
MIFYLSAVARAGGHGSQDHRRFKQRYFEFLDYHRAPGGPIFLRICGESACGGIPNDYLAVSRVAPSSQITQRVLNLNDCAWVGSYVLLRYSPRSSARRW